MRDQDLSRASQAIRTMAAQFTLHVLPQMCEQQAPIGHLLVADAGVPERLMVYAEGEQAATELLKLLDALGLSAKLSPVKPGDEPAKKSSPPYDPDSAFIA